MQAIRSKRNFYFGAALCALVIGLGVGQAVLQQTITSFPKVLCVQLRRYVVSPEGGWQPVKLNVAVDAPMELAPRDARHFPDVWPRC